MSTPPSRFKRSAWSEPNQQPPEGLSAPEETLAAAAPAASKLTLELKGFRFMSPDTGFMIAYGRPSGDLPEIPPIWRGRLNKDQVTIKGASIGLADMNSVGTVIECGGEWALDPKFGLQYQFTWAREAMPSTIDALRSYLAAGRIKGIGPATAKLIVDKWGMETMKVLSDTPEKLIEIPGITEQKVAQIKAEWAIKSAQYQLTAFFGLYGVGEVWVPKIIEALGPNALEARVRDNPYLLTLVDGIGFATADKMALSMGLPRTSDKRSSAMLVHLLNEYTNKQGHTARLVDDWLRDASIQLSLPAADLQGVAQNLINTGAVVMRTLPVVSSELFERGGNGEPQALPCVSLKREYMNERGLANDIKRLVSNGKTLTTEQLIVLNKGISDRSDVLDASQIEGVMGVLSNGVSVLTGGPGTGKTTTLKSVIDIAEEMGWSVVLAAPTGRAAKRMEEAIGRPAGTVHRTLKFSPKEGFMHHRKNPLVGQLFVVDEASMLDNALAASWLKALPDNARVIFVGDIDQLPSVGAGNFLKDIMASSAAQVFRLTRVHRQAEGSLIAEAAQRVLSGRLPSMDGDPWTDDFAWMAPPTGLSSFEINEFIQTALSSLVDGYLRRGFKKEDIQVLTPQRDGLVGVTGLNDSLRWQLNELGQPTVPPEDDEPFSLGDRLLVTKNNYDKDVFNGDMGVVQKLGGDGSIELLMEDGKTVTLERSERKSLTLGYAITVHKSQGGERPVILMACSPSHSFSMNKNLIYTGITRGRKHVVVVGSPQTMHSALKKQERMYRLTGLVSEIHQQLPPPKPTTNSFQPRR